MSERRKHARYKIKLAAIIHSPYNERKIETVDISVGGGAIHYSSRYYNVGQSMIIEIILPGQNPIRVNARVVWIYPKNRSAASYKVGLEFPNLPDPDKNKLISYFKTENPPST
jgi:c-di-GMP-binding flagellar brake protein YcgR